MIGIKLREWTIDGIGGIHAAGCEISLPDGRTIERICDGRDERFGHLLTAENRDGIMQASAKQTAWRYAAYALGWSE